jgi:hypothetical protein
MAEPIRVVVLDGDQTGQELLDGSLRVLDPEVVGLPIELERFDLSLANRRFVLNQVKRRTAMCDRAGFDGIEYDVVDAYAQGRRVTGFRITAREQLRFNRSLARIAHSRGLAVGLKNDLGQIAELEPRFDFAINEQCLQYRECTNNPAPGYRAFLDAGKAVAQVEYRLAPARFCPEANRLGLSSIKKAGNFSLSADPWVPCR